MLRLQDNQEVIYSMFRALVLSIVLCHCGCLWNSDSATLPVRAIGERFLAETTSAIVTAATGFYRLPWLSGGESLLGVIQFGTRSHFPQKLLPCSDFLSLTM